MPFSLSFGAFFLRRRRFFPGADDLEFDSLVRERSALGIDYRIAGLSIDDQGVSVTRLETFGKVNLIFQPGGRVLRQVI
jgi:hypothetical protein